MNDYAHLRLHEASIRGTMRDHRTARPRARRRRGATRRILAALARVVGGTTARASAAGHASRAVSV